MLAFARYFDLKLRPRALIKECMVVRLTGVPLSVPRDAGHALQ